MSSFRMKMLKEGRKEMTKNKNFMRELSAIKDAIINGENKDYIELGQLNVNSSFLTNVTNLTEYILK